MKPNSIERSHTVLRCLLFRSRPMMKLLEVIRIAPTSDETFQTMLQFGKALGKTTVSCKVNTCFRQ